MAKTYEDALAKNEQSDGLQYAVEELREHGLHHTADMMIEMSKMLDAISLIMMYNQGGNEINPEYYK